MFGIRRAVLSRPHPLATVPWIAQWKLDADYTDNIGGQTLTPTGSPTFTTGILPGQGALQLVNASSQRALRADNANLSTGNVDFLISAWVYLDSVSNLRSIVGKYDGAGAREYYLIYTNAANRFQFSWSTDGTTTGLVNWSSAPSTATWYHVLVWHDSTLNTINICVNNGTPVSAALTGGFDSAADFYIGRAALSNYMDGRIRNVCVAKGAGAVPSAAVREALYNGGSGQDNLF